MIKKRGVAMEECVPYKLNILVKIIHKNAKIPTKAFKEDAGWDLYAYEDIIIRPQNRICIPLGIKMEIPNGYLGFIKERSSSALLGIHTLAGIIDSSYRGEVKVVLRNCSNLVHQFKKGDKIAQMLILPVPDMQMIQSVELSETERNEGGFGSTGS